jgi:hypothetical protein
MKQRGTFAMTAAALALAGSAAAAGAAAPSMSSAWLSIRVSQDECIQKGTAAARRHGFASRLEVLANAAIYAERGDYTVLVRCAAEKGLVYFVVAGPEGPECNRHMSGIRDAFQAG